MDTAWRNSQLLWNCLVQLSSENIYMVEISKMLKRLGNICWCDNFIQINDYSAQHHKKKLNTYFGLKTFLSEEQSIWLTTYRENIFINVIFDVVSNSQYTKVSVSRQWEHVIETFQQYYRIFNHACTHLEVCFIKEVIRLTNLIINHIFRFSVNNSLATINVGTILESYNII